MREVMSMSSNYNFNHRKHRLKGQINLLSDLSKVTFMFSGIYSEQSTVLLNSSHRTEFLDRIRNKTGIQRLEHLYFTVAERNKE